MRIVETTPDFWPHVRRGMERVVHDLSLCLHRRGHDVTIVTRTPTGRAYASSVDGVPVRYRQYHRRLARLTRWQELETFALTAGITALVRDADVYHAHHPVDAYGMTRGTLGRRRAVVLTLHGPPGRRWWETALPRSHRWLLAALDAGAVTSVVSQDSARRMREDYGIDPVVLYPGIFVEDYVRPRPPSDRRTIVSTCALDDPRKRVDLLVSAFATLAAEDEDLHLLLVGPGSSATVRAQVAGLAERVAARIIVRPATDDVAAVLATGTVGALTGHHEGLPLSVIEFLAAGMPAVGCDDGGVPEILDPGTGVLCKPSDLESTVAALREALALAADVGTAERCRRRAQWFDWSARLPDWLALYERLSTGRTVKAAC